MTCPMQSFADVRSSGWTSCSTMHRRRHARGQDRYGHRRGWLPVDAGRRPGCPRCGRSIVPARSVRHLLIAEWSEPAAIDTVRLPEHRSNQPGAARIPQRYIMTGLRPFSKSLRANPRVGASLRNAAISCTFLTATTASNGRRQNGCKARVAAIRLLSPSRTAAPPSVSMTATRGAVFLRSQR